MKRCLRFLVTGRVQGVWYRGSTREQAQLLGISGWAKNCPDGRVEVVACGEREALERLRRWLWDGPPLARVTGVEVEELDCEPPAGFRMR